MTSDATDQRRGLPAADLSGAFGKRAEGLRGLLKPAPVAAPQPHDDQPPEPAAKSGSDATEERADGTAPGEQGPEAPTPQAPSPPDPATPTPPTSAPPAATSTSAKKRRTAAKRPPARATPPNAGTGTAGHARDRGEPVEPQPVSPHDASTQVTPAQVTPPQVTPPQERPSQATSPRRGTAPTTPAASTTPAAPVTSEASDGGRRGIVIYAPLSVRDQLTTFRSTNGLTTTDVLLDAFDATHEQLPALYSQEAPQEQRAGSLFERPASRRKANEADPLVQIFVNLTERNLMVIDTITASVAPGNGRARSRVCALALQTYLHDRTDTPDS